MNSLLSLLILLSLSANAAGCKLTEGNQYTLDYDVKLYKADYKGLFDIMTTRFDSIFFERGTKLELVKISTWYQPNVTKHYGGHNLETYDVASHSTKFKIIGECAGSKHSGYYNENERSGTESYIRYKHVSDNECYLVFSDESSNSIDVEKFSNVCGYLEM